MTYHMILGDILLTGGVVFGFLMLGTALYGLIKSIMRE